MNNTKFIFLCALFTFFVLNPVYSSDSENQLKETESVKNPNPHNEIQNTLSQLETSIKLPKPIIKIIGEHSDLSTLSSLCRVNKRFHAALQDYLNSLVVDEFYKEVSKNPTFVKKFFEQESDFKEGLESLVCGEGSKDHSLTAYKLIRNLPNRNDIVHDFWMEMKSEYFRKTPCEETITFNYGTVFKLYLEQEKLSFSSFGNLARFFKFAEKMLKTGCYSSAAEEIPALVKSYWAEKNNSKLKPIFYDLIILYRNIYLERNSLTVFFENPGSVEILEFIQHLPVNFKNYKQEMPSLSEKIKNKTLLLAQKRMKIIEKLNCYFSIG